MPCFAFLLLGILIGHNTPSNVEKLLNFKLSTECSTEIKTEQFILRDSNIFRDINWVSYNCTPNVKAITYSNAIYFSTWSGDTGNSSYGECYLTYIETNKINRVS
jgi:hypothetical protein